jgi:hypothetical protein
MRCTPVLRFRSSHRFAATSHANFGNIKEHWQLYDSSAVYEIEIPAMDSPRNWQEFQIHRTSRAKTIAPMFSWRDRH